MTDVKSTMPSQPSFAISSRARATVSFGDSATLQTEDAHRDSQQDALRAQHKRQHANVKKTLDVLLLRFASPELRMIADCFSSTWTTRSTRTSMTKNPHKTVTNSFPVAVRLQN
eukprot:613509-Amphidinium_carterae.1